MQPHIQDKIEKREEENDATYGIYNYISEEKLIKERDDFLIINDFKNDIFYEFIRK